MAAAEALIVQGEDSLAADGPAAVTSGRVVASQRWPHLIPVAQLLAVILGVLAIIWNQQQTTDSLRSELTDDINRVETTLTAKIDRVETTLTADINRVETGLDELRVEVANIGQRLARIEGFLGTDIPDDPPQ